LCPVEEHCQNEIANQERLLTGHGCGQLQQSIRVFSKTFGGPAADEVKLKVAVQAIDHQLTR